MSFDVYTGYGSDNFEKINTGFRSQTLVESKEGSEQRVVYHLSSVVIYCHPVPINHKKPLLYNPKSLYLYIEHATTIAYSVTPV